MKSKLNVMALALGALLCANAAHATARNDIPDCYGYAGLTDQKPTTVSRELVVAVDETTAISDDLKKEALKHVLRFAQAGDRIVLYRFSAYTKDSHMVLVFAGDLESTVPQERRSSVGMTSLKKLDTCLAKQHSFFNTKIAQGMGVSFGKEDKQIARSDIMLSLKQIGDSLSHEQVDDKVLFLVSDMLENSDVTSFYHNNTVKQIDPHAEMEKAKNGNLMASLDGVKTYVMGAGFIQSEAKYGYRSSKQIQALQSFWDSYFKAGRATLQSFGAPILTRELE